MEEDVEDELEVGMKEEVKKVEEEAVEEAERV